MTTNSGQEHAGEGVAELVKRMREPALGPGRCPVCGNTRDDWWLADEPGQRGCREEGQCDWNTHHGTHTDTFENPYLAKEDMIKAAAALEKLTRERDEALEQRDYYRGRDKAGAEIETELRARIAALEAENARLREALEPFAKEHAWAANSRFEIVLASETGSLTGADLDRARAILGEQP